MTKYMIYQMLNVLLKMNNVVCFSVALILMINTIT